MSQTGLWPEIMGNNISLQKRESIFKESVCKCEFESERRHKRMQEFPNYHEILCVRISIHPHASLPSHIYILIYLFHLGKKTQLLYFFKCRSKCEKNITQPHFSGEWLNNLSRSKSLSRSHLGAQHSLNEATTRPTASPPRLFWGHCSATSSNFKRSSAKTKTQAQSSRERPGDRSAHMTLQHIMGKVCGKGWGAPMLSTTPPTLSPIHQPGRPVNLPYWVFNEVSLHHGRLNYWTLVIDSTFSPSPLSHSPAVGGGRGQWKCQACSHMVGSSGHQPHP